MADSDMQRALSPIKQLKEYLREHLRRADYSYEGPKLWVTGDPASRTNIYTSNVHKHIRCLDNKKKIWSKL